MKHMSGSQKRKKKQRQESIAQSLKFSLNKYFDKQPDLSVESEQQINLEENENDASLLDQSKQQSIYEGVNETNEELNHECVDNEREQLSTQESFRIDYFLCIVDIALSQLKSRFEQMKYFESIFGFLFDAQKLINLNDHELLMACMNLENALKKDDHFDVIGKNLHSELQVLQVMLSKDAYEVDKSWTSIKILEFVKEIDMFPNVMIAYRILLTIPVTVASTERSFSKLKLLKSYLRTSMSQDRLNGLAILCIEKDMLDNIDQDDIINDFASKNALRDIFK